MFKNMQATNSEPKTEVKREVKCIYGELSSNERGWSKKVTITSWNGGEDKLDIRDWNTDMTRCGKGISLTNQEAFNLYKILDNMFRGR